MRYPLILLLLLALIAAGLAIAPHHRQDWALENSLALAAVVVLVATWRTFRFSNLSYTLGFVLLVLHEVGAHYTYSCVPYDRWFEWLTGRTLNSLFGFERNHYDRLVHFLFGFLLAVPMREVLLRLVPARGLASYWLPVQMTLSWSAIYEIIEWLTAEVFGGGLGAAFLGTQGDEFDAEKDTALAATGAVLAMCIVAAVHRAKGYDAQRRWLEQRVPDLPRGAD